MLSIILQTLYLFVLLIILGEPLRALVLRRLSLLSDLDFIQKIILDAFVGGMLLYFIAILPFGLFSYPILAAITITCSVITVLVHIKDSKNWKKSSIKDYLVKNKQKIIIYSLIFAIFLIFLYINFLSVSNCIFGSVRDESTHSLYVQVIVQNQQIQSTLLPYLPEGIIYPQASHVIFAYAYYMLNMDIPQIVLYVSLLFKGLTVFGAYFLGKKIGRKTIYGLGLSFVFAFISYWPLNVNWGANPFIIGFPFFLICLGLLFSIHKKQSLTDIAFIALLFGFVGAIILSYFETLLALSFFLLVYYLVENRRATGKLRVVYMMIFAFLVSLIPLSPFLYRFFAFYTYPHNNIGIPNDVIVPPSDNVALNQPLTWAFGNLSSNTSLSLLIVSYIIGFILILSISKDYLKKDDVIARNTIFSFLIFISALILIVLTAFTPPSFNIISWGHQGIILSIPVAIILLNFFFKIFDYIYNVKASWISRVMPKKPVKRLLVVIILLSLLVSPFLYYRFTSDIHNVKGAYSVYAVTTKGDYELMLWMRDNLNFSDSVILVHPYSSGLFIPSVSHLKIIYPYTYSAYSLSYVSLVKTLTANILNSTTYETMKQLNINYVFVGASVNDTIALPSSEYLGWHPELFLNNENFILIHQCDDAYLFKFQLIGS